MRLSVAPRVSAYLGDRLLADDLPVLDAALDLDRTTRIPARLGLALPRTVMPRTVTDPLAPYGQTLTVDYLRAEAGTPDVVPVGTFLITNTVTTGDVVEVEAVDLRRHLLDARLTAPRVPPAGATFASELRALCAGILPVAVDAGLVDRALPAALSAGWDEDRLDAAEDIAREWPATLDVTVDGVLTARPPATSTTPVATWAHGQDGAYIYLSTRASRDDIYNAVVARGQTPTGEELSAIAVDRGPGSPTRWDGPFGRRPRFHYSPLITTQAVADATARTMLTDELARAVTLEVTAAPDPSLRLSDPCAVQLEDGSTVLGRLQAASIPLTAEAGSARYLLEVTG